MQPSKITIAGLFDQREQYLIPLFQRGYVWRVEKQISRLWEDIVDQFDAMREHRENATKVGGSKKLKPLRKHFLGAVIVSGAESHDAAVVPKREVIDGQQRLTTLQILLLAFRDLTKGQNEALDEDLRILTTNRGQYRSKDDQVKVWPTNVGRDVMKVLYDAGSAEAVSAIFQIKAPDGSKAERPLMVQAYLYFAAMIAAHLGGARYDAPLREGDTSDEPLTIGDAIANAINKQNVIVVPGSEIPFDPHAAHDLMLTLQSQLQIMRLQLDEEDDPQIIFETLNALGEPLTPSDLIRNYVFLRASRSEIDTEALYNDFWRSFDELPDEKQGTKFWREEERQGRLLSPRLDLFFFHYVILRQQSTAKVAHVFEEFKEWWESEDRDFGIELGRIGALSRHFRTVVKPGQATRFDLFCRRMKQLDTSTHTPLLLYLLEHHEPEDQDFVQAIIDIESFVVRRFVCGLTTQGYNRIFLDRLLVEMAKEGKSDSTSLRAKLLALTGPSQRWPNDEEFEAAWLVRRLYQGANTRRVRAVLEGLEAGLKNYKTDKEFLLDDISVEHVMPQKWQPHYPLQPDTPESRLRREDLVHSIGNLTLVTSSFNSALSNERFSLKRPEIAGNSAMRLNAYFQKLTDDHEWNEDRINARAKHLFETARSVWPHPWLKDD